MSSLPPITELGTDPQLLTQALTVLLEAPADVIDFLTPPIFQQGPPTSSYKVVLDEAYTHVKEWPLSRQVSFIAGHPRIGERRTSAMSDMSKKEQGSTEGDPQVMDRLQKLNSSYEHLFPGLRYITFVNGRSKAEVADEMESKLQGDQTPLEESSPSYEQEVKRAVEAIFDIAHSRLQSLSSPKDGIR